MDGEGSKSGFRDPPPAYAERSEAFHRAEHRGAELLEPWLASLARTK